MCENKFILYKECLKHNVNCENLKNELWKCFYKLRFS